MIYFNLIIIAWLIVGAYNWHRVGKMLDSISANEKRGFHLQVYHHEKIIHDPRFTFRMIEDSFDIAAKISALVAGPLGGIVLEICNETLKKYREEKKAQEEKLNQLT